MATSGSRSVSRWRQTLRWPHAFAPLAVACAAALLVPSDADARRDRHYDDGVVACSHYGRGCVRGAVRQGQVERQVRMPGGTWIGCKRDCARTLREEALDYFETLRDRVWDN